MMGETVAVNGAPVANVLVEPVSRADREGEDGPAGTVAAYTLRFPADYPGPMSGAVVEVRGQPCRTVGFADHLRPAQVFGAAWAVPWDMTVTAERVPGAMNGPVQVVEVSAELDGMGEPSYTERTVWEGEAQARMTQGDVSPGTAQEATAKEEWHFVVPWDAAFAALRPQAARIMREGVSYAVESIRNVDGESLFCDFSAMRHG